MRFFCVCVFVDTLNMKLNCKTFRAAFHYTFSTTPMTIEIHQLIYTHTKTNSWTNHQCGNLTIRVSSFTVLMCAIGFCDKPLSLSLIDWLVTNDTESHNIDCTSFFTHRRCRIPINNSNFYWPVHRIYDTTIPKWLCMEVKVIYWSIDFCQLLKTEYTD